MSDLPSRIPEITPKLSFSFLVFFRLSSPELEVGRMLGLRPFSDILTETPV